MPTLDDWTTIKGTLYEGQKLIDLLNMRAGDQKIIGEKKYNSDNRIKDQRDFNVNVYPIKKVMNSTILQSTKKSKPILYFAQSGSDILVLDNLSKVYSIKLETGELNWTIESKVGFNSNAKIIKNSVVAIDFDNVIRAFSVKDGKELWNFDTDNPFIKSQKKLSLVTKGEVVFFINSIGDVTALNANDGSLVWQTPTQSTLIFQDAFTLENSDIIFANDTIYFSNNRNEFFAIDARSGVLK